jgi:ABC-type uncharacterized transport system substrate-binding protein
MTHFSFSALLLSLALALPAPAQSIPSEPTSPILFPTTPHTKPGGGKWRIGYVGSGDYIDYSRTLRAIVQGLAQLGWLTVPDIPEDLDARQMWNFLAENVKSKNVTFVADAWQQPGNFDATLRPVVRAAVSQRINEKNDLDLIIAMGTWAGQDMAALGAPVPTIVASTSDAVGARIVASAQDSGLDNLHARVQPERYQRQVRLFHEIVPFKILGMVYEDSAEGRTYAAVPAVEQVAQEQGFEVKSCDAPSSNIGIQQAEQNALDCYSELASQVDAMYVSVHRGVTIHNIADVATILRHAEVPSFAMLGSTQVRAGLLMSLAQADYSYVGLFHAETIARVFNGARPRQLSQIWIDPPKIAVNLETARRIGFDPPVDILLAADEVYEEK